MADPSTSLTAVFIVTEEDFLEKKQKNKKKPQLQALHDTKTGDATTFKSFQYSPRLTMLEFKVETTNGNAI